MRRRDFIAGLGGAAASPALWPFTARAQQAMPVIGYFNSGTAATQASNRGGVPRGPEGTGFVEGQNVAIEFRWADNQFDRLPALVAESMVARPVAVIVANTPCGARAPRPRPRRSRSCSRPAAIRCGTAWSRASTGRAATSPAWSSSPACWAASGSRCCASSCPRPTTIGAAGVPEHGRNRGGAK